MRRFSITMLLAGLAAAAFGEVKFPPPEFTTGYSFPTTTVPGPRAGLWPVLDIAVLAAVLALSTYLVHTKRSRRGLFALMLVSLAYFGFYREGCVCSIGAIQNVALSLWGSEYALPLAVGAFFLLPLVFALFVGRVFCAGVCPQGAAQDLVVVRPKKVPRWLERALGVIPYLYLGTAVLFAATGSAFIICEYDPFIAFFRRSGTPEILILGAAFLLAGTVIARPYCRFLCPYGALLRLLAPLAMRRVTINPPKTTCINCRLCEEACPFGAINVPTPEAVPAQRREGKRRLALLLILLPLLLAVGGGLGYLSGGTLATHNPTVRQANAAWLAQQQTKQPIKPTEDINAELYRKAAMLRRQFNGGGLLLGLWAGLVIGIKLVALSVRRRTEFYEADPATCVACGRCFALCPVGKPAAEPAISATSDDEEVTREPVAR